MTTYNKHGSFYVRTSWPMKGLVAISEDPSIFTPQNEMQAVDTLGIGKVMVRSLRYWLTTMLLASEEKDNQGKIVLYPTTLGKLILENDRYFQKNGTAWLLHRNIAKNRKDATTWYWFFNEYNKKIFTKDEFISDLRTYANINGKSVSDSSLKRDFDCLKNTYEKANFDNISDYIEEGIHSYFSQLELIEQKDKNVYRKKRPLDNHLACEILLYAILEDFEKILSDKNQIDIDKLYEEKECVSKIYNLSYTQLLDKLDEMEKRGYIKIYSRFGHNHIEIE